MVLNLILLIFILPVAVVLGICRKVKYVWVESQTGLQIVYSVEEEVLEDSGTGEELECYRRSFVWLKFVLVVTRIARSPDTPPLPGRRTAVAMRRIASAEVWTRTILAPASAGS